MQIPKLDVQIRITPHQSEISNEELDKLFFGEIKAFEQWVVDNQKKRGHPNPQGLINMERALVQSFMIYLYTKDRP